jgi:hypothetical protein
MLAVVISIILLYAVVCLCSIGISIIQSCDTDYIKASNFHVSFVYLVIPANL